MQLDLELCTLYRERTLCCTWAAQQREITRVYFYGSRVWGTPEPDSDLDILIVAHPGAIIGSNDEWTAALTELLGLTVHLNDHFTADPGLLVRISAKGLMVFSRHNSESDFEFEDEPLEFDPNAE